MAQSNDAEVSLSNELQSLITQADELRGQGRADEALPVLQQALALAESEVGENTRTVRNIQRRQAVSLFSLQRIGEAEEILNAHVSLSETLPVAQRQEFSVDFEILSAMREKDGLLDEAFRLIDQAIGIQSESSPPNERIRRLGKRAYLAMELEKHPVAVDDLGGILEIPDVSGILPHATMSRVYSMLVEALRAQEKYADAKNAIRMNLRYLEDIGEASESMEVSELYAQLGLLSLLEWTYEEAVSHFERALAIATEFFSEDSVIALRHLDNISYAATMSGKSILAADAAVKALAIAEAKGQETEEELFNRRKSAAESLLLAGDLDTAKQFFKRILADKTHGQDDLDLLWKYASIYFLEDDKANYQSVLREIREALAATNYSIVEVGREGFWNIPTGRPYLGAIKLDTALNLITDETEVDDNERVQWMSASAEVLISLGYPDRAGEGIDRLAVFVEERFGREDWNFATVQELRAQLAFQTHETQAAKSYLQAAIEIRKQSLSVGQSDYLEFGNHEAYQQVALIYESEGNLAQAIQYATLALTMAERSYGVDSSFIVPNILQLAHLQVSLGNIEGGITLLNRLKTIENEKTPLSTQETIFLGSIASRIASHEGDETEALRLTEAALENAESSYWYNKPLIAEILLQKAGIHTDAGQFEISLDVLERALGMLDRETTPLLFADVLFERGRVRTRISENGDAEQLALAYEDFSQVVSLEEELFGKEWAPSVRAHHALAGVAFWQGRLDVAMKHSANATELAQKRIQLANGFGSFAEKVSIETVKDIFMTNLRLIALNKSAKAMTDEMFQQALHNDEDKTNFSAVLPIDRDDFEKAFRSAQWVGEVSVSNAVRNVGARLADSDGDIAQIVRDHQDQRMSLERLESDLLKSTLQSIEARDISRENKLTLEIQNAKGELERLNKVLTSSYPQYLERLLPGVVSLDEAQSLIEDDEALVLFRFDEAGGVALLVTQNSETLVGLGIDSNGVERLVEGIRESLTVGKRGPRRYAKKAARTLYQAIFEPLVPFLEYKQKIVLSVDGPLLRFPFEALVASDPVNRKNSNDSYAEMDWLGDHFSITVTPSVQVMRSLRRSVETPEIDAVPFIGIGNPVLGGGQQNNRRDAGTLVSGDGLADPQTLRSLPALPETGDELQQMAEAFGNDNAVLYLGNEASELKLRGGALESAQILVFATHGTLAQDYKNVDEPALVLTPPDEPTEMNDGLLTASEIALEKLQADLIVLSACNTSASDGRYLSSGLSGLAKAFFYAGTKSLMVSHWPIESAATVILTTGVLKRITDDPTMSVAEAIRATARQMRTDPQLRRYAHPVYWAPFSVIGG